MVVGTPGGLPSSAGTVVVGAGVHGLSTAYHLALELERRGRSGRDVVVLERSRVGAGASGNAAGVVRGFYFSPAMVELVRLSLELFEREPERLGYHPVGYVAAAGGAFVESCRAVHEVQAASGYPSTLVVGEDPCRAHMGAIFPDWRGDGIEALLHEHLGGWAAPTRTAAGLASLAAERGVRILEGVEVLAFDLAGEEVAALETSAGRIEAELVVVAPGPWAGALWRLLGLPASVRVHDSEGEDSRPIVSYWKVQEADLRLDGVALLDAAGREAPVVHVDHPGPLHAPDGSVVVDGPWGVYYRSGPRGEGVRGGSIPQPVSGEPGLDPYPDREVDEEFADGLAAALAWAHERFHAPARWHVEPAGAVGALTPDAQPIVGFVRPNAYVALDSNHGFKLVALGKLIAAELAGATEPLLEPFRLSRFDQAAPRAAPASPFPWR